MPRDGASSTSAAAIPPRPHCASSNPAMPARACSGPRASRPRTGSPNSPRPPRSAAACAIQPVSRSRCPGLDPRHHPGYRGPGHPLRIRLVVTDHTGRWSSALVPKILGPLTFKLAHPEFLPAEIDLSEDEAADQRLGNRLDLCSPARPSPTGTRLRRAGPGHDHRCSTRRRRPDRRRHRRKPRNPPDAADRSDGRFRVVMIEPAEGQILVQARGFVPQQRSILIDRE
jgi:hypothetical protein